MKKASSTLPTTGLIAAKAAPTPTTEHLMTAAPAIIILGSHSSGFYDVGYKHGNVHPEGAANMLFMDTHIGAITRRQTNGIVMDFKKR